MNKYITNNYTREQFDNLKYIKSTLTGYVGENYINTDTHNANYEAPYSLATISLSKNTILKQETNKEKEENTIVNNSLNNTPSFFV